MADPVASLAGVLSAISRALADAAVCRVKAARLRLYCDNLAPKLAALEQSGTDTTLLQGALQDMLELVQGLQKRGSSARARLMAWCTAYQLRARLEAAESHLQTLLALFNLGVGARQLQEAHERERAEDAQADVRQLHADMDAAEQDGELPPAVREEVNAVLDEFDPEDVCDLAGGADANGTVHRAVVMLASSLAQPLDEETANIAPDALVVVEGQVLGRGRFGEVLLGELAVGDKKRRVAVKRVPHEFGKLQLDAQQALRREAAQWQGLDHPNIVKLIGTCVQRSRLLLVMERCDMSLEALLYTHVGQVTLSVAQGETLIKGVARGMAFLHSQNVIHRDIKPANVLLSRDLGKVKVADFGVSIEREGGTSRASTLSVAGSPSYMAPEVLRAPAVWTTRADVYSFGILAWEVIHRRRPWADATSIAELHAAVVDEELRPVFSEDVQTKIWLARLVINCWKTAPRDRPYAADVLATVVERTSKRRSTRMVRELLAFLGKNTLRRAAALRSSKRLSSTAGGDGEWDSEDTDEAGREEDRAAPEDRLRALATEVKTHEPSLALLREIAVLLDKGHDGNVLALRALAWERGIAQRMLPPLASTSSELATEAMRILTLVGAGAEPGSARTTRVMVRKMGVGASAVNAMNAHRGALELQRWGCLLLARFARSGDNKVAMMELDAGAVALGAMRKHPADAHLSEAGCVLLRLLASNDDYRPTLMAMGAGAVILDAMRLHETSAAVAAAACGALWTLAVNSANQLALMKLDAATAVLAAIKLHPDNERVASSGCGLLRKLADEEANQQVLAKLGTAACVLDAMRAHPGDARVQSNGCGALLNMAVHGDTASSLMTAGAGAVVLAALKSHTGNAELQEEAAAAQAMLMLSPAAPQPMRLESADAALDALREHGARAATAAQALCLLHNSCAGHAWVTEQADLRGARHEVVKALRVHANQEDVIEWGEMFLDLLNTAT